MKKILCPNCQSEKIIPIHYGLPNLKGLEQAGKGEIKLGGCCVSPKNPNWHCKNCGKEFKGEVAQ